jgi:hypothetical protein
VSRKRRVDVVRSFQVQAQKSNYSKDLRGIEGVGWGRTVRGHGPFFPIVIAFALVAAVILLDGLLSLLLR